MAEDLLKSTRTERTTRFSAKLTIVTGEPVDTELVRASLVDALDQLDPYIVEYEISDLVADGPASP